MARISAWYVCNALIIFELLTIVMSQRFYRPIILCPSSRTVCTGIVLYCYHCYYYSCHRGFWFSTRRPPALENRAYDFWRRTE